MKKYSLASLNWELVGTKPHYWRLWDQMAEMRIKHPENEPVRARVPGSVQQSLLNAGIIPDWNIGTNYRNIEWIENRHWLFFADLPDELITPGEQLYLHCQGLDGDGEIWINGTKAGEFNNTHLEYTFDLTSLIRPQKNRIAIIFFCPERYQGQVYWTSMTKLNKPRFYYNWDWCPRIIQTGIWDDISLISGKDIFIRDLLVNTTFNTDNQTGKIKINTIFSADPGYEKCTWLLTDKSGQIVLQKTIDAAFTKNLEYEVSDIQSWSPNGLGEQYLYTLVCHLFTAGNQLLQTIEKRIGFRKINWLACKDTNPDADPWLLAVNDKPVFMQGVNWTPIRTMFADVTQDMYREWLMKYKDMGANMLRVWGGATLEKSCFYEICDELGLMVWQEFPLSSSGICNTAPTDEIMVNLMGEIVESYIRRRIHHPSLIAWSGGNELYNEQNDKPLDFSHPLLAKAKSVCDAMDPDRRMMPSSPSGPTIYYDTALNGKGLQWDVHGPWWLPVDPSDDEMTNIRKFWESSDALFHSEAGVPGASDLSLILKYKGDCSVTPIHVENPLWGQFSWWVEADKFETEKGREPESPEEYVVWQQNRQTKGLAIAVEAAKKRFPSCGGFLIWMGHDCFPCPANTSIIDFDGNKKPAAKEIEKIWKMKTYKF
jgi:beta-mannosidase